MNIPKKLNNNVGVKLSSTLTGQRELIREMRNKINELVEYLQEEASKGECDVMCNECMPPKPMNDHKYLKGVIIHERTDCPPDTLYMINENLLDKVIPPEQENEFFKLIMEYKLSDFTHMAKMISKELKSEYISKEKIKEYVSDKLNCYSNTDYRVALKDLSESLGLGD